MDSFRETYPALDTALGGEFHDSDTGDGERIRAIGCLLKEARSIRANLDEEWGALGEFLSRPFARREDAARWLDRAVPVWEMELARLQRG